MRHFSNIFIVNFQVKTDKMDLLKTPSVQSLLDSDLESVESLQYLDIEEVSGDVIIQVNICVTIKSPLHLNL